VEIDCEDSAVARFQNENVKVHIIILLPLGRRQRRFAVKKFPLENGAK